MEIASTFKSIQPRYPELSGRVAIITGSSRGIGRGIALRLAREGMKVVINGRSPEPVHAMVAALGRLGVEALGVSPASYRDYVYRPSSQPLSEEEEQRVRAEVDASIARLAAQGKLPAEEDSVTLNWPLRPSRELSDPGYHGVSGLVDHGLDYPGHVLDYNCGTRTYDRERCPVFRYPTRITAPGQLCGDADERPGALAGRLHRHLLRGSHGLAVELWGHLYQHGIASGASLCPTGRLYCDPDRERL